MYPPPTPIPPVFFGLAFCCENSGAGETCVKCTITTIVTREHLASRVNATIRRLVVEKVDFLSAKMLSFASRCHLRAEAESYFYVN